ncbi:uncharacterized protein LOC125179044, partial [Hyalella azteca]|uniref:Uncharacterized protein LOC125179044 n=1 Tax=Hyalella azteca TaxID=294128 RepID=A0A979FUJ8_HYAAZ
AGKDTCAVHSARKNFWCQTCKMAVCRDCTVVGHRQALGHKVLDHDEAVTCLRGEVRQAALDTRNLRQETRKLRHDQRVYLNRQLDACRAFEKQLKAQLKALSSDKKEEVRDKLERAETDASTCTSLTTLIETARRAGEVRLAAARDFAMAKKAMTDNLLAVTQLNRSSDELDMQDGPGTTHHPPGSPNLERKGKLTSRGFRQSWHVSRPAISFDGGDMAAKIRPLPKVYIDLAIEGIQ